MVPPFLIQTKQTGMPRPARHDALLLALLTTACRHPIRDRIYQPPTAPLVTSALPARATVLTVTTADGLTLHGATIPAKRGKPTLLVFHGNASSALGTLQWFAPLAARGYGIVAAEYRGYAGNPGQPGEAR